VRISREDLQYVAQIYDAVLDGSKWRGALDGLAARTGAKGAALVINDWQHHVVNIEDVSTVYPRDSMMKTYREEYATAEVEAYRKLLEYPAQHWVTDYEAFGRPPERISTTHWMHREFGTYYRAAARLNADRAWYDAVSVHFAAGRGHMTEEERRIGQVYLPHFAKAIELMRPIQILRARFRAVFAALDRFHIGVILVADTGEAVLWNEEIDRIVQLADGFTIGRDRKPLVRGHTKQRQLHRALDAAIATSNARGDTAATVLPLPRPSGGDPYIAEVCPLRAEESELDPGFRGALMFLVDPEHRVVVSVKGMEAVYRLTPAEADILQLLVDGFSTADIAACRNRSRETVRTHIKSLFSKANVSTRPQLIRRALSLNLPIDDPAHSRDAGDANRATPAPTSNPGRG